MNPSRGMKKSKKNKKAAIKEVLQEKEIKNSEEINLEATDEPAPGLPEEEKVSETEAPSEERKSEKKDATSSKRGVKKQKKTSQKKGKPTPQEKLFTDRIISNLSRALGANDWIKLAYALGFLPQGIAHFVGRASSAQNTYSQCTLMLRTWRNLVDAEEILPRLCDALQRIRRRDLAVKVGLELALIPTRPELKDPKLFTELLKMIRENADSTPPPYEESRIILNNDKVSFIARHLLAREEWKRLAYALGFYPDDASHIIATASSSQNLYAQAHMMLLTWRDKTRPEKITESLRAAFTRIRRHDLVFLLDMGIITSSEDDNKAMESLEEKLKQLDEESKAINPGIGSELIAKFKDLHV